MAVIEKEMEIVKKKAKKYKKFLEKIEVNQNPTNINGKHYYQVVYSNHKDVTTGIAIFSPEQDVADEAYEAYPVLSNYNGLLVNIYEESVALTKVPDYYYTEPLELMKRNPLPGLSEGKEKIERLYELHQSHKKYFKGFTQHIARAEVISQQDVDIISTAAASTDLIHLKRLHIMSRDVPVFVEWKNRMNDAGLWKQLPENVRVFYNEVINGAEEMGRIAASWHQTSADTWEGQLEEFLEKGSRSHAQTLEKLKKDLRWPEPR